MFHFTKVEAPEAPLYELAYDEANGGWEATKNGFPLLFTPGHYGVDEVLQKFVQEIERGTGRDVLVAVTHTGFRAVLEC